MFISERLVNQDVEFFGLTIQYTFLCSRHKDLGFLKNLFSVRFDIGRFTHLYLEIAGFIFCDIDIFRKIKRKW